MVKCIQVVLIRYFRETFTSTTCVLFLDSVQLRAHTNDNCPYGSNTLQKGASLTCAVILAGWQKLRGHGGSPPKSLDSDKNFKPEHTLFCRELRFVAIYALFGDLWAKKRCLFGSKTVFLGQEVHYYVVYIAYFTELNLQICYYAEKQRICRKNCKYALDENFHDHFCPRRKAAKFCHPGS